MLVSEDTAPKLRDENKHLQDNVAKLTAQLEETEMKLQSECVARKDLEDNLDTKVKDVESSWNAVLGERKDNWEAKEKSLEDKVESQERLLNELKATYETNQRLGKAGDDQEGLRSQASRAELEMLHSDLERTSARLADVESRNEQMRLELAEAKSSVSTQPKASLEDNPDYMRMRSENSSLIRKLDSTRLEKEGLKRELGTKVRSAERELALLKDEKESLRSKVQKWSDYDEVKQELEVLKSIEFSTGDDDDEIPAAKDGETEAGNTLEKLLLGRNKKLGDELTVLRVSHQDLQTRLEYLQEEMSKTNADLERCQNLNERLESDLEQMHAEGANAFPSSASVAGTYVTRAQTRRGGRISPTSSIISGLDPRGSEREPMGGGSGILPMVTAQRDRFKQKNAQLEKDVSESHKTVQQLRQEVAALQKDNLNLYEKTRYISTYNRSGATSSSATAYGENPNPSTVAIGGTGTPGMAMDRYRAAYESNISPFAAFRGRESARAYQRMSLPERAVYSITRMVLASRSSRNLFAAYCVALHLLVFMCLYWLGASDLEKHAGSLGATSAAAGGAAAKGAANGGKWKEDGFADS